MLLAALWTHTLCNYHHFFRVSIHNKDSGILQFVGLNGFLFDETKSSTRCKTCFSLFGYRTSFIVLEVLWYPP